MVKNFLFYAFSTFINSWAAKSGAGEVFKTWGIVSLCLLATCIPMCKSLRRLRVLSLTNRADIFGKVNRKFMRDMYAKHKVFRVLA